jgi:hypothetical protein
VSDFGYYLMQSTLHPDIPGAIVISVSSTKSIDCWNLSPEEDESPYYRVSHTSKWPDLGTGVAFTRDAPGDLVAHAFDLQLGCLWSLAGCRTANQLLPEAEHDRQRIEREAIDRMKGPRPDSSASGRRYRGYFAGGG